MATANQAAIALLPTKRLTDHASSLAQPRPKRVADFLAIAASLGTLAVILYRNIQNGLIAYPDPKYAMGDYYRYINMALPNGDAHYNRIEPFVYRILVPDTVHMFVLAGIPYTLAFFCITSVCLAISTIAVYFLARGYQLGRAESFCASLGFLTLEWAVSYNIHDYFLVDPTAQMFIVLVLLAVQRQQWIVAIILGALGVLSKESVFLAIALVGMQLVMPMVRSWVQRVGVLIGRPKRSIVWLSWQTWVFMFALAALSLGAFEAVHHFIHPIAYQDPVMIRNHYLGVRFKHGVRYGLLYSFDRSTWGTYGLLFAWAIAALLLGVWRRAKWSGWSLLVVTLLFLYSYSVSGDNERLAINVWPFMLVMAFLGIHEVSRRTRVSAVVLWGITLIVQFLYQPTLAPPGDGAVFLGHYLTTVMHFAYPLTLALAALLGLTVIILVLIESPPRQAAFAASAPTLIPEAAPMGISSENTPTIKRPKLALNAVQAPLPKDAEGAVWVQLRAGLIALSHMDLWVARLRLEDVQTNSVYPLALRYLNYAPETPITQALHDQQLGWFLNRWHAENDFNSIVQAYRSLIEDYRQLRTQLRLPSSEEPRWEGETLLTMESMLHVRPNGLDEVVSWDSLSIILPAYNEEAVIAETVADCLAAIRRFCPNAEVIVVDDGSRDGTGAIIDDLAAQDARVVALHNRPNKGYGGALLTGFAGGRGKLLFFMDSDGQFDINEIATLLQLEEKQPGAVVLGYRQHRRDPFLRRLNAWGWKQVVRLMLGLHGIRDIDCAFKLFPADLFRACQVTAQGAMVNTELLVKLQRMHVPAVQVPVQHFERQKGKATGANLNVILKAFSELGRTRKRMRGWRPPQITSAVNGRA